jgi:hypothetical protein
MLRYTFTIIPIPKIAIGTKLFIASRAGFKPSFLMGSKGSGVSTAGARFEEVRSVSTSFTRFHVVLVQDFENEFVFVKKVDKWA